MNILVSALLLFLDGEYIPRGKPVCRGGVTPQPTFICRGTSVLDFDCPLRSVIAKVLHTDHGKQSFVVELWTPDMITSISFR